MPGQEYYRIRGSVCDGDQNNPHQTLVDDEENAKTVLKNLGELTLSLQQNNTKLSCLTIQLIKKDFESWQEQMKEKITIWISKDFPTFSSLGARLIDSADEWSTNAEEKVAVTKTNSKLFNEICRDHILNIKITQSTFNDLLCSADPLVDFEPNCSTCAFQLFMKVKSNWSARIYKMIDFPKLFQSIEKEILQRFQQHYDSLESPIKETISTLELTIQELTQRINSQKSN
jgi:hypothetical protein